MASAAAAKRLEGKTVLITGASSGIGRSTAFEFARTAPKNNLKLVLTARRVDTLNQIAADIKKEVGDGVKVLSVKLDISNPEEVRQFVPNLPAEFKDIHVLVNNAGLVKGMAKAPEIAEEDVSIMFATNVTGLINMTQAILPVFKQRPNGGSGDIINIGSIAGREPYPGGSIYCATKAAVKSFTDALRKETLDTKIRVIGIDPGQVETEFSIVRFYGDKSKADAVYAGVDPLTPDDIAEVIVFSATRRENVVIADTLIFPQHQGGAGAMHRKADRPATVFMGALHELRSLWTVSVMIYQKLGTILGPYTYPYPTISYSYSWTVSIKPQSQPTANMATNASEPSVPENENGWAMRVKASYTPSVSLKAKSALEITQGEDGWAFLSTKQPDGWVLCQIGIGKEEHQRVGWVHITYIIAGKERMRPLPIDMRQPIIAVQDPTLPGNATCLEKTVHGLWRAIQANRNTIETELPLSPEISFRLFGPNTSHYPIEIMRALDPPARALMSSGNFHPRQLAQLPAMSKTDCPTKPGIYIRVYPGIESPNYYIFGRRPKPPGTGLYTGQTIGTQWPLRFDKHERDMASSKAMHYRLARTCDTENVSMIPIILFDENQPMVRVLTLNSCLSAAELTMVCLFKSWHPLLLGPTPLNAVAAYILDFQSARVFGNIIDSVNTGWRPAQIVGCNWQTPVIRDQDRELTWCSWFDYEKEMKVFRCARRLFIEKNKDGTPDSARLNITNGNDLFIPREVLKQSAGSLTNGITVHVVVEFMGNAMDHPSMFVRFPRIGPNFPSIYQVGMKVARILQCINYTGARVPGWLTAIGRVVVKEFNYDHLKQELVATNTQSRVKQWPADNTIQQNTARLQQLISSKGWSTSIGVRPDRMLHNRVACDICVSQATLQTGAIYSELGMTTNVYYMTNEADIQKINAPFDPKLDQDQDEDQDG
ncbi:hypothetical protein J7T55_010215 [Diaporthe amygdali]|uniref:uncharacterized protein n=1 Tax=Phomopsis amygdali TaxID=1214568 RepID=UPI0022FF2C35|nr:uncharacterized protein J7T55_010215 [Diaporthe amygdali]KAJ0113971.1 hypothetical protein J7T55_010215 [Diaporthe amygdali]